MRNYFFTLDCDSDRAYSFSPTPSLIFSLWEYLPKKWLCLSHSPGFADYTLMVSCDILLSCFTCRSVVGCRGFIKPKLDFLFGVVSSCQETQCQNAFLFCDFSSFWWPLTRFINSLGVFKWWCPHFITD